MPTEAASVRAIFDRALEIATDAERSAYLDLACAGAPVLRREVEALLAAHAQAGSFLQSPAAGLKTTCSQEEESRLIGTRIGPYKPLQQIGEGGMGIVYMAQQERPVQRMVALKIIKPGMDSTQVIARFEAERQALAVMDHPNIAKVLDAGTTNSGRPYFVMELVKGIPIIKYADEYRLTPRQRLELFIPVCHAVQHAHQKGIIHRDLKPTNVLVADYDDQPVPKVIDFGVAKAIGQHLTEKTVFTQLGQVVGTIEYMSPEQAKLNQLDIDTRTDIYSLGVLLYELLTGETPFDRKRLRSAAFDEMLRIIREEEPPKPSTRLSSSHSLPSIAAQRHLEPRKLTTLVAGELDWIVMKALEKDRARRYQTANGLAEDLHRYLTDQPVEARRPTRAYRLKKFIRRNKLGVLAGTAIVAALAIGLVASTYFAATASREAERARLAEHRALATLDELRATAPTFVADAKTLAAKGQFDLAIEKLDYAAKLQPDAPELLVTKGDFYLCQLKLPEAAAGYRDAMRLKPGFAPAEMKANLCDQLLAAPTPVRGKLSLQSLVKIYPALEPEKRSTAELNAVKEAYADEKERLWKYWLPRLQSLPMFANIPSAGFAWERHFDVRNDGQLSLYLGDLDFSDLSPLKDLPVADLYLGHCKNVTDVQPLADMPTLENITVPVLARNIEALHKLPKLKGLSFSAFVTQTGLTAEMLAELNAQQQKQGSSNPSDQTASLRRQVFFDINGRMARPTPDTTAEEFWKLYSTLSWLSRLRDSAIKPNEISRQGDGTWTLDFDHKKELTDLTLLHGMPISELYCGGTSVTDLSPLRGMPLKNLRMWGTRVTDLTPIKGMPITHLEFSWTHEINDLSPLKGMPLDFLSLDSTAVSDLTPLRGMPLTVLRLNGCANLTDLSPLADAKQLRQLILPPKCTDFEFLHALPKLERVSFNEDDKFIPDKTADQFWASIKEEPWVNALRIAGLKPKEPKKLNDGTWELELGNSAIRDLTPLKGTPISRLSLGHTAVTDLAPLRGMKLKRLALNETQVADLEPLRGMPIEELFLSNTKVIDLSPLSGMPLRTLNLRSCTKITDISALADCRSLKALILPPHAKDIEFLRSFPQLEQLSYKGVFAGGAGFQTPKDFWAEYDHNHAAAAP